MLRYLVFAFAFLGLLGASTERSEANPYAWKITKESWSSADELEFQQFVISMGESDCSTVTECMADPKANPYRKSDPPGLSFTGDCADFPYYLRAYFSWKKGLPFAFADTMTPRDGSLDARFSKTGNVVASRTQVVTPYLGAEKDFRWVRTRIKDYVYSATFRTHPDLNNGVDTDTYPIKISRGAIRPGTMIYDINAHVLIVYEVKPDGRILWVDASPDNSVKRGVYGRGVPRTSADLGSGFRNWRPINLVGATRQADGSLTGGRIELARNDKLSDFSTVQYVGTHPQEADEPKKKKRRWGKKKEDEVSKPAPWVTARFVHDGQDHNFYEYVRHTMALDGVPVEDPLVRLRSGLKNICTQVQARAAAVEAARKARIHKLEHPQKLPKSIFAGEDEIWTAHATAKLDARIKKDYRDLHADIGQMVEKYYAYDDKLAYSGISLKRDLAKVMAAENEACAITYRTSSGRKKALTLSDIGARLFDMSFDPYHCPEMRWGESTFEEGHACIKMAGKAEWYKAQRFMRRMEASDDRNTGYGLTMVGISGPRRGLKDVPETDIAGLVGAVTLRPMPPEFRRTAQR